MARNEHYLVSDIVGKKCSTCHKWRPLNAFGKRKSHWDGLNWECKDCIRERAQKKKEGTWKPKPRHRVERRMVPCACGCGEMIETPGANGKERRFVFGHWARVGRKGKYADHLRKANEQKKIRHTERDGMDGKECSACHTWKPLSEFGLRSGYPDGLAYRCRDCIRLKGRKYYRKHRERIRREKKTREYRRKFNAYYRKYAKRRRRTDPAYRIKKNLRAALWSALNGAQKVAPTMELIGCTPEELKAHLESQFLPGMTWENYGQPGWEIDHIIPCASFDLTDPAQQKVCFHYTNLQPLWGPDNWAKSDRMPKGE